MVLRALVLPLVAGGALLVAPSTASAASYTTTQPQVSVSHCSAFWGECDVQIPMPELVGYTGPTQGVDMDLQLTISNSKRPLSKPLLPQQQLTYTVPVQYGPAVQLTLDAGTYSFTWQARLSASDPWGPASGVTEVKMGGIFGVEDPTTPPEGSLGEIQATATRVDKRTVLITGRVTAADGVSTIGGDSVVIRHRVRGQSGYRAATKVPVDRSGFFHYTISTGKKVYVSVSGGDVTAPQLVSGPAPSAPGAVSASINSDLSLVAFPVGYSGAFVQSVGIQIASTNGSVVAGPEVLYVAQPGMGSIPIEPINFATGEISGSCMPHPQWSSEITVLLAATCTYWSGSGPTTIVPVRLPTINQDLV